MLTWPFAIHLNRTLVELEGLVIERTEVDYLKSFPFMSFAELQVFRSRK